MNESLVDTDILSYYFKGEPMVVTKFNEYLSFFEVVNVSIITFYEIMGGLRSKRADKQLLEFKEFINNNSLIHISEDSAAIAANIYADLRSKGITIGTSDILIAGIAIENELTLVTNNVKHYSSIEGLKLANWKV